jgi:hypothetical protein
MKPQPCRTVEVHPPEVDTNRRLRVTVPTFQWREKGDAVTHEMTGQKTTGAQLRARGQSHFWHFCFRWLHLSIVHAFLTIWGKGRIPLSQN